MSLYEILVRATYLYAHTKCKYEDEAAKSNGLLLASHCCGNVTLRFPRRAAPLAVGAASVMSSANPGRWSLLYVVPSRTSLHYSARAYLVPSLPHIVSMRASTQRQQKQP